MPTMTLDTSQVNDFVSVTTAAFTASTFATARKAARNPGRAISALSNRVLRASPRAVARTVRHQVGQPCISLALLMGFKGVGVSHAVGASAAAVLEASVHRRIPMATALTIGATCLAETVVYRRCKLQALAKDSKFGVDKAVVFAAGAGVAAFMAGAMACPLVTVGAKQVARRGISGICPQGLGQGLVRGIMGSGKQTLSSLGATTLNTVVWWGTFEACNETLTRATLAPPPLPAALEVATGPCEAEGFTITVAAEGAGEMATLASLAATFEVPHERPQLDIGVAALDGPTMALPGVGGYGGLLEAPEAISLAITPVEAF